MKITEIRIIHNYDGCHVSDSFATYLNCSSLTALSILLDKFYVARYDGMDLYPLSYVSYKYALSIEEVIPKETDYEFFNMNAKHIESYIPVYSQIMRDSISLAKVDPDPQSKYNLDYTQRLSIYNPILQIAIDINSFISKYEKNNFDIIEIEKIITEAKQLQSIHHFSDDILEELIKYCIMILEDF